MGERNQTCQSWRETERSISIWGGESNLTKLKQHLKDFVKRLPERLRYTQKTLRNHSANDLAGAISTTWSRSWKSHLRTTCRLGVERIVPSKNRQQQTRSNYPPIQWLVRQIPAWSLGLQFLRSSTYWLAARAINLNLNLNLHDKSQNYRAQKISPEKQ